MTVKNLFQPRRSGGVLALTALIVLSAAAVPVQAEQASEQSPSYNEGDKDGCSAGKSTVTHGSTTDLFKDRQRFRNDDDYAEGWMAGFKRCQRDQITRQRLNEKHEELKDLVPEAPKNKRTPPKLPSQLDNN